MYRNSSINHVPTEEFFLAEKNPILTAIALSFAAAIALGLSRFSYGLLLPPMRADLGWSYLLAGTLNTANAVGYLVGVLLTSRLMRATGVWNFMVIGSILASFFVFLPGTTINENIILVQRLLSGVASAFIFIAGGVLAARLASKNPTRSGLILGIFYGGPGIGIMLSSVLIPVSITWANESGFAHPWQWSWYGLAVLCLIATVLAAAPTKPIGEPEKAAGSTALFEMKDFAYSLGGYLMFGIGYIGYMTFIAALLKEYGISVAYISAFYFMLGFAVFASSRVWAGLLDKYKGGQALAILNAILGVACILPVISSNLALIFISGLVFGGVFLSAVASTTALVRHNLQQESWPAAISAFTGAFALGQIIGPAAVGGIADTPAGLTIGLLLSAITLFVGAALAIRQKPLTTNVANFQKKAEQ